jgi:T5SS/PEP-CTERM-associated repeat protein
LTSNSTFGVGIDVGQGGQATLEVINGGTVSAPNSQIRIGDSISGIGIVNVSGSGSTLTTGTDLLVAINGLATLNVTDGGTVVAGDVSVGDTLFGPTGTGTVLVDGTGSNLISLNSLFLENNSTLDIKNGGQVEIQDNVVSGFFNLAFVDSNLNINSGGKLISGRIGNNDDPTLLLNANAMVSGTGSTWSNDGIFDMRDGSLTITSGAEVILKNELNSFGNRFNSSVEDEVVVTVNGGSRLAIGTDPTPSLTTIRPDLILTSRSGDKESILRVSDPGSVVEIERSFHVGGFKFINRETGVETIVTRLPGHVFVENGAKMTIGETLILFGNSTFNFNGGTANIGAGPEPTTSDTLRVGLGGSLEGTGTVNGNVLNDGGVVSPGLSPGKLSIGGDYTQNSGTLLLEIGGTTPDLYDQLFATGNVFLDGTLQLSFINSFLPQIGQSFDLISGFSSFNFGNNFNVSLSGIAGGWQYAFDVSTTGRVTLQSLSNAQPATSVPEPSTILGLGILGFGAFFKCKLTKAKESNKQDN